MKFWRLIRVGGVAGDVVDESSDRKFIERACYVGSSTQCASKTANDVRPQVKMLSK